MKHLFFTKSLTNVQFQRNFLLGLSSILLFIVVLQSIFLFLRSEKTIILPPEIKQSFWVDGNRFAPSYLEEQATYFCHLFLDVTPSNVLFQGELILRYVFPEFYSNIKAQLLNEQERLKKENLTLHFIPLEVKVYPDDMFVLVIGELNTYVGSKKITVSKKVYRVDFLSNKE
ncbi:MAG: hypothetical protein HEEMFOPI_01515 [Holosporales bacterium]